MEEAKESMQLLYSVPSLGLDESKGPPSFVFVTHQLVLEQFPYRFPESSGFFITNGWLGSPGVYQQRILISKPNGKALIDTSDRALELDDPETPYMAITFFQGLEIEEPGIYRVSVFLNGKVISKYPFHVLQSDGDSEAFQEA